MDNTEYSKLLSSIKIANTNLRRVLSPIQTAQQIKRLIDEEGIETVEEILPLNKNNIMSFVHLLKLPEECHDGIVWGRSGDMGVGFSAASHIAALVNREDKLLLFNETSKNNISEKDVQQIISFYKKNDKKFDISLVDIIAKTTNARPSTSHLYIVVISISSDSKTKLENNAKITGRQPSKLLEEYFKQKFKITDIDSIELKGKNIAIGLKEHEYRKYKQVISTLRLEYDQITKHLIG